MLRLAATVRLSARGARLRAGSTVRWRSAAASPSPALAKVLEKHALPEDAVPPTADPKAVEQQLRFLELLGVPRGEGVGLALRRHPGLIDVDPATVAAPRIEYLLAMGVHQIGSMVRVVPQFLDCDMDMLHKKVTILQLLGVRNIARYISRNPTILALDIGTQIKPAIQYMRTIEGLNVAKVIEAVPASYALAPPEKMAARVEWFRSELGIDNVGKLLSQEPRLLTFSIADNIGPKVEFLRAQGFSDVGALLARRPQLFCLSLEDALAPRLAYLTGEMGLSVEDVARFPTALGYSLDFIRRRHRYLALHGRYGQIGLGRILRSADHEFAVKLAQRTLVEFSQFLPADDPALDGSQEYDKSHEPMSPTDKHIAERARQQAVDQERLDACEVLRAKVFRFLRGEAPVGSGAAEAPAAAAPAVPEAEAVAAASEAPSTESEAAGGALEEPASPDVPQSPKE